MARFWDWLKQRPVRQLWHVRPASRLIKRRIPIFKTTSFAKMFVSAMIPIPSLGWQIPSESSLSAMISKLKSFVSSSCRRPIFSRQNRWQIRLNLGDRLLKDPGTSTASRCWRILVQNHSKSTRLTANGRFLRVQNGDFLPRNFFLRLGSYQKQRLHVYEFNGCCCFRSAPPCNVMKWVELPCKPISFIGQSNNMCWQYKVSIHTK